MQIVQIHSSRQTRRCRAVRAMTAAVGVSSVLGLSLFPVGAQQPAPAGRAAGAGGPLVDSRSLVGSVVRNAEGKDIGKIDRLMIDPANGRVVYAVVSMGGMLGLGAKNVAMPWNSMRLTQGDDQRLVVVLEQTMLDRAPAERASERRDEPPAASPSTAPGVRSSPPSPQPRAPGQPATPGQLSR